MNEELAALARSLGLADPSCAWLRHAFGLACVERVRHLLEDVRAVAALDCLGAFVAGLLDAAALKAACAEVALVARSHPGSKSIDGAAHAAVSATNAVAHALAGRALDAASYAAYASVYVYGGSAVMDREAFADEFRWQVGELGRLAEVAGARPSLCEARDA